MTGRSLSEQKGQWDQPDGRISSLSCLKLTLLLVSTADIFSGLRIEFSVVAQSFWREFLLEAVVPKVLECDKKELTYVFDFL